MIFDEKVLLFFHSMEHVKLFHCSDRLVDCLFNFCHLLFVFEDENKISGDPDQGQDQDQADDHV